MNVDAKHVWSIILIHAFFFFFYSVKQYADVEGF